MKKISHFHQVVQIITNMIIVVTIIMIMIIIAMTTNITRKKKNQVLNQSQNLKTIMIIMIIITLKALLLNHLQSIQMMIMKIMSISISLENRLLLGQSQPVSPNQSQLLSQQVNLNLLQNPTQQRTLMTVFY